MVSLGVGRLNEVRRGNLEREQRYDRKRWRVAFQDDSGERRSLAATVIFGAEFSPSTRSERKRRTSLLADVCVQSKEEIHSIRVRRNIEPAAICALRTYVAND